MGNKKQPYKKLKRSPFSDGGILHGGPDMFEEEQLKSEGWEERFMKFEVEEDPFSGQPMINKEKIKQFIANELAKERQKLIELAISINDDWFEKQFYDGAEEIHDGMRKRIVQAINKK